ncbi:hypothetical protein HAX54_013347, partial [Datura stramonium]|nr:hypothetical protein [Datura stramonium]
NLIFFVSTPGSGLRVYGALQLEGPDPLPLGPLLPPSSESSFLFSLPLSGAPFTLKRIKKHVIGHHDIPLVFVYPSMLTMYGHERRKRKASPTPCYKVPPLLHHLCSHIDRQPV